MAQSAPHYGMRKIINTMKAVTMAIFWAIFAFSVVPFIVKRYFPDIDLDDALNTLNIISICVFFILDVTTEYILTPVMEGIRRDDFLDNSFGTTFSLHSSVKYFDNEDLPHGMFKAAANLFENCFFTYSLVKALTIYKILIPAIIMVFVAACTYFGFKAVPFALSFLQVLFSAKLLGSVLKHCILLVRLGQIQSDLISLFQQPDFNVNSQSHHVNVLRLLLQYETLHSSTPADIPDRVFKKLNDKLTSDWQSTRIRYNIKS